MHKMQILMLPLFSMESLIPWFEWALLIVSTYIYIFVCFFSKTKYMKLWSYVYIYCNIFSSDCRQNNHPICICRSYNWLDSKCLLFIFLWVSFNVCIFVPRDINSFKIVFVWLLCIYICPSHSIIRKFIACSTSCLKIKLSKTTC